MSSTGVWLWARDAVDIPKLAYGANNEWTFVPNDRFNVFAATLKRIGCVLMRFPGGFESEWYNWDANTATGYDQDPVARGSKPGANAEQVLSRVPVASFVLATREYISAPTPGNMSMVVDRAERVVEKYKDRVSIWEIGNEWYRFSGWKEAESRAKLLTNYISVAKQIVGRIKRVAPSADVYVGAEWTRPDELTTMKLGFGDASWANVDGVALHVYAGDDTTDDPSRPFGSPKEHHINTVIQRIQEAKKNSGLSKIYVSEWGAMRAYTNTKLHLRASSAQMELMWNMLRAGITAATIWPSAGAIPGLNLMDEAFDFEDPTGQSFAWMARDMVGKAVSTKYQAVPAVSARNGNRLVVFLFGKEAPEHDVTVHVEGYTISNVVSADVRYSLEPNTNATVHVTDIPHTLSTTNNTVTVTINPGGDGRGSSYEIIRLVLNGVVES